MTITAKHIETNENGVKWFKLNGFHSGTEINFVDEVVGLTEDGRALDCDGAPVTPGDYYEIAIMSAIA